MELSLLLAKSIGLMLMIVSVCLLTNRKNIDLLFNAYKHAEAVFITGFVETFLGIVFVLTHNIWTPDFRGALTLIGWLLLLRGLGRIFFPNNVTKWLDKFKKMQGIFMPLMVVVFLLGLYLVYMGFTK